jgi:hypothetical protein
MILTRRGIRRLLLAASVAVVALPAMPLPAPAQEVVTVEPEKDAKADSWANQTAGEFTPAKGFDIFKSGKAYLNISFYGVARYVNQMPAEQTYLDHLGRVRTVKARNDINWHRAMVWFNGYLYTPKFRYNVTVWSLATTQQTLVFGWMQYSFNPALAVGAGIAPNLTNRSMNGSFPFWAGSDRQMAEEFLRAGFASGVWVTGSPLDRFYYKASVNTNLSQLGVTATNDSRDLSYSASLWWMPTTGEFGPRGGFGDLEDHQQVATRFGLSACHGREYRGAPLGQPNNETQLRLSDGVYVFEADALADGVTVEYLDYDNISFDAGFKYKGFSFQGEYTVRSLSNFAATGPVPHDSIIDQGFFVEAMHMVVPKKLGIYAVGSYIMDEFERKPWEVGGGASFYPFGMRSWRLNLHILHVDQSPTGSNFGYYTAGQTGTTISLGTDILI